MGCADSLALGVGADPLVFSRTENRSGWGELSHWPLHVILDFSRNVATSASERRAVISCSL